ncbi:hypothetical protein [Streptomyces sp. FL07-04A]
MLARYQPRKWSEALDVDKSPSAAHWSTPSTSP